MPDGLPRLAAQGAPAGLIGAIIGFSGVVPLLIALHAGALVDERGPALVTQGAVILYAVAGVMLTALHAVWPAAAAYALMGIANIGWAVASQAVVAAASTPATRVRNYGYYSLWNSAGAVVGPVIGGFVTGHFGYRTAFALVWVLMIPSLPIAGRLPGASAAPLRAVSLAMAHRLVHTILRERGVGAVLFISFIVVCAQTLQQTFYPLYLSTVGLSPTLIGIVIAAISLGSMVVRSLLSRGVDRFGYAGLLNGATALLAVTLGITPLLRQFWPLVAVSALMGASLGFTQPPRRSATEIQPPHLIIVGQVRGTALQGHLAGLQDIRPRGDLEGHSGVLLDEDHRHPIVAVDRPDRPGDLPNELGRETQRRLVQQQRLWAGHQRAADRDHLLLASGEGARLLPEALPQTRKARTDPLQVGINLPGPPRGA